MATVYPAGVPKGSPAGSRPRAAVDRLSVCVGFATRGRPGLLKSVIDHLRLQTLPPSRILVSCVSPADVAGLPDAPDLDVLYGPPGLARQRNAILDNMPATTDVVAFFDDDFVPHPDWLSVVARTFRDDPTVACITGHVLADGINGPGLTMEEALACIARSEPTSSPWVLDRFSPYGCNMAFRRSAIGSLRFDERLVLYGWLEDRDLGAALARRGGRLVKLGEAQGVHLGSKSGRVSGKRLGYSQMINPIYLYRKGTMTAIETVRHMGRNVISNLVRSATPEPYIDRIGRLAGNGVALVDLVRGRVTPERAETL